MFRGYDVDGTQGSLVWFTGDGGGNQIIWAPDDGSGRVAFTTDQVNLTQEANGKVVEVEAEGRTYSIYLETEVTPGTERLVNTTVAPKINPRARMKSTVEKM
jgi:hypothetical protein